MDVLLMLLGMAVGVLAHLAKIEWLRNGWFTMEPESDTDDELIAQRLAYYAPPLQGG